MYDPEYVLILSGDHIYKMDYAAMLAAHKETNADCTIAAIQVPIEEASRFGVLNTNPDGTIYEFEEKPKKPKSDLASMGIYIFTASKLYKYLEEDELNEKSSNDFGKNILPAMLANGEKMCAYKFKGYWKDVGTIASLYDANMDLLGNDPEFDIMDNEWTLHSRNPIAPPHYLGNNAKVSNSMIGLGCNIEGTVENSVLSHNVTVKKGAIVRNAVIFSGGVIEEDAVIDCAILDENVKVGKKAMIGKMDEKDRKIAVVGRDYVVADGGEIAAGDIVEL